MEVNRILQGNALDVLKTLPDASVQTVVTSPPYWGGLRDYNVPATVWDGDECCRHEWGEPQRAPWANSVPGPNGRKKNTRAGHWKSKEAGQFCQLCWAWKGCLGQEPDPQMYARHLVQVFREVRRVLRKDGTCWLNLGDSYAGGLKGEGARSLPVGELGTGNGRSRVGTNFFNCLDRLLKGQPLFFGNANTIRITAKRFDIPLHDNRFPYGVLLSLFGIERITIKQRNNNFCQVLHLLNGESYCWIAAPMVFLAANTANLEIVFDVPNDLSIVISQQDADMHPVLAVTGVPTIGPSGECGSSLSIKETAKPIAKCFRDIEPFGDAFSSDSPLKRLPDIYLIDQPIAFGDTLDSATSYGGNLRVRQASPEQICFSLDQSGIEIRTSMVAHFFVRNACGSFIRYNELYDKAQRQANTLISKQELGIPEMVKRALMEDGWLCRSTIIWSKPNCQPESVLDRPTKAHEYVFLLSRSPRYYYDPDSIREPHTMKPQRRLTQRHSPRDQAMRPDKRYRYQLRSEPGVEGNPAGRNRRSVWTIPTSSFDARRLGIEDVQHFAVMPAALADLCLLAGSSPYACEVCHAPWRRITEKRTHFEGGSGRAGRTPDEVNARGKWEGMQYGTHLKLGPVVSVQTLGWGPTCRCPEAVGSGRCTALDPFCGAGTVLARAAQLGRDYLGIELSRDYIRLAEYRIARGAATRSAPAGKPGGLRQLSLLDALEGEGDE